MLLIKTSALPLSQSATPVYGNHRKIDQTLKYNDLITGQQDLSILV